MKLCLITPTLALLALSFGIVGCTATQKTAATSGIDLADATCRVLDQVDQDEPAWLKVVCLVVEAGGETAKKVVVRLPASSHAAKMLRDGAKSAPPCASLLPAAPTEKAEKGSKP